MDPQLESLIVGLLDKANDVLDGILARQECRAPVAVFPGKTGAVLCDDGTLWEYAEKGGWVESCDPIPGTVADTFGGEEDDDAKET